MQYPEVNILYLNEKDVLKAGVNDVLRCTDCMEELLKLLEKGDYRMGGKDGNSHGCMVSFPDNPAFPNMPANGPDRRFMAMPAYVGGKFDIAGMKWYGSNVGNRKIGLPRSILMVMLNDKTTGAPLSLMSGNLISAYRTAAIPGVGVRHLARKDAKVLGIVGPGVINSIAIETFAALRPTLDTLKIKGRGKASIGRCIAYVKRKCPQFRPIIVCDSLEECVRGSDILSFAISSPTSLQDYPLVRTEWIKKGALFCMPGAGNFEDGLLTGGAKLVVDNLKMYETWSEDYPYPTFQSIPIVGCRFLDLAREGKLQKSRINDLGAILNGQRPGRESEDQIIVYSIGGMPVEDVAWGKELYDYASAHEIGTKLNLWEKPYLF
jgi:ornithine cyclodeaminase